MTLIHWNDDLSVNVAEIDRQHQKMVVMINELNDEMRKGQGRQILGKIIEGLLNYAGTHFLTEERYFAKFGYPGAEVHRKEHAAFARKVSEFKEEFDQGRVGVTVEVMSFLSGWLTKHIRGEDRKYIPTFQRNGLK